MQVHKIKVFTKDSDCGNLAGVVLDSGGLSDEERQKIALQVNASETAFVTRSERTGSDKVEFGVRWFTPSNEVGICIHATIAAVTAVSREIRECPAEFAVETRHATLNVRRDGTLIFVNVPDYRVDPDLIETDYLCKSFGFPPTHLSDEPRIVSIYDDRELVVPVRSLETLAGLTPTVTGYTEICQRLSITGISLFAEETRDPSHHIHLREFAPLYGYLEDPLCGMAAGCVMTYLRSRGRSFEKLMIEQGFFCDTGGTIHVRFEEQNGCWIGGDACTLDPLPHE